MGRLKTISIGLLRVIGLYNTVHRVWVDRSNLRLLCWNMGYRLAGAEDHLPIPPTRLIYQVILSREIAWFLFSGKLCQESIQYVLQRNGWQMNNFHSVLDFGCGCGRIIRHWKLIRGPHFYGTDYNPDLIAWCNNKLSHIAEFKTNHLVPPLDYPDDQFDFIYGMSVFTHLTDLLQQEWISELNRVLCPNGVLLLSLHGNRFLNQLNAEDQKRYKQGELVVLYNDKAGTNVCGSYHPEQYVRTKLASMFELLDHVASGAQDSSQDIYLFRKPDKDQSNIRARI